MLLIGLTGGIGMGKTAVSEYLQGRGEPVVDTDLLARELVEPGQPAHSEIRQVFGRQVFDEAGRLDRKALGEIVFEAPQARARLEAILHPRIRQRWRDEAEHWRKACAARGFVVIPLLYETGAEKELDRVLCVACSTGVQRTRLMARGWAEEEIARRLVAQWLASRKMDLADGVIWNESTREMCEEQCARLLDLVTGERWPVSK
jgi:dephospho-CoA kinase